MIFVTVGTQLAFDRLIASVDAWAEKNPDVEIFAQIGPGAFSPKNFKFKSFVSPSEANGLFRAADLVVSHAGMGSILTALKYKKPILVMPRKASLGEHRNEHQLATAKWLGNKAGISVANEAEDVCRILSERTLLRAGEGISDFASPDFTARLRGYIDN